MGTARAVYIKYGTHGTSREGGVKVPRPEKGRRLSGSARDDGQQPVKLRAQRLAEARCDPHLLVRLGDGGDRRGRWRNVKLALEHGQLVLSECCLSAPFPATRASGITWARWTQARLERRAIAGGRC